MLQYRLQKALANSLALVGRRHANLVDPELRRSFVRVQVDDRADETDYKSTIHSHHETMTRVCKKIARGGFDDGVIKDLLGNVAENEGIGGSEQSDFDHGERQGDAIGIAFHS